MRGLAGDIRSGAFDRTDLRSCQRSIPELHLNTLPLHSARSFSIVVWWSHMEDNVVEEAELGWSVIRTLHN